MGGKDRESLCLTNSDGLTSEQFSGSGQTALRMNLNRKRVGSRESLFLRRCRDDVTLPTGGLCLPGDQPRHSAVADRISDRSLGPR
jgi:hypothetical protein